MGSPGTVMVLLVQFWVLQGATGLTVQQAPKLLQVRQDSQVTLACQVMHAQAWEWLRVEWIKDADIFCQTHIINGSLSKDVCGPQGWLSWQPPGNLTLQLNHVSLNDSGLYVCGATVEIPDWEEAQGNGTQLLVKRGVWLQDHSFSGLYFAPLVTGAVAVAVFALGAGIWGRRRCRNGDAGSPIYSNVLYRPRRAPRKKAWPVERKVLDSEDQKGQSFYSISFPQHPKSHMAPKSCPSPRPIHPISAVRISPGPGSSGQPRSRGFLEVGREIRTAGEPEKTYPQRLYKDVTYS
ncbi:PREDICTED: transmembrane and immunoglobulin domain-containing protein 2 [Bison bison bison]|uniref:transmembrane and immunoglobulin domain-containing protein 2 n=1 Tax=Bison bison bison TaxID=43346 RepID=UPI000575F199|nr:PREDICTED: transmembrane and immunoglobulin domain-containing protein 2 [Bison bison bison]